MIAHYWRSHSLIRYPDGTVSLISFCGNRYEMYPHQNGVTADDAATAKRSACHMSSDAVPSLFIETFSELKSSCTGIYKVV